MPSTIAQKHYCQASYAGAKEVDGQKIYTYQATGEQLDRDGEIITMDGWDFESYHRNPVILDSHDYRAGIKGIVGKAIPPLRRSDDGWEVDVVFAPTTHGQDAQVLADAGMLNAVSVGFISLESEKTGNEPRKHTKKELLEISVVPIPSNRDALRIRSVENDQETFARDYLDYIAKGNTPLSVETLRVLAGKQTEPTAWTMHTGGTTILPVQPMPIAAGKTMDFDAALEDIDRRQELCERRWDLENALYKAMQYTFEDEDMTYDEKVANFDTIFTQYHTAMLDWVKAVLAEPDHEKHLGALRQKEGTRIPDVCEPSSLDIDISGLEAFLAREES